jgi:hypothetical protein
MYPGVRAIINVIVTHRPTVHYVSMEEINFIL